MTQAKQKFVYDDGGRSKYFKAQHVADCVPRAIAIATGKDYKEVYDALFRIAGESPRNGVKKSAYKRYIEQELGWTWHATMQIGTGTRIHLTAEDLPQGRIICRCSHHLVAVIDGVIRDTYDCTRDNARAVYGYWTAPNANAPEPTKKQARTTQAKPKARRTTRKAKPQAKPAKPVKAQAATIKPFAALPVAYTEICKSLVYEGKTNATRYHLHIFSSRMTGKYYAEYINTEGMFPCCNVRTHNAADTEEQARAALLADLNKHVNEWNADIEKGDYLLNVTFEE